MKPAGRTHGSARLMRPPGPAVDVSSSATGRRAGREYVVKHWGGQRLVIALPYLWLLVFFLVPFLIVLYISFAESAARASLPYAPVCHAGWTEGGVLQIKLLFGSYDYLINDPLYVSAWVILHQARGGLHACSA